MTDTKRCFQDSFSNGPRKIDEDQEITRCLDCSRVCGCEFQNLSKYPATTIAEGCPLPDARLEEDASLEVSL